MSKPETTYYTAIHRLLPKAVHREKMHNIYRGGTADVWYSGNLDDLWVEYKYVSKPPKRTPLRIWNELSELQRLWLNSRRQEGRNVCVILGTPVGSWIYEFGAWNNVEVSYETLTAQGLTRAQVADFIRRKTMLT